MLRFQFLDGILRVAFDKLKSIDPVVAVYRTLDKLDIEGFRMKGQQWRDKFYLNKEVDLVFKDYYKILEDIYQKYSGKKTLPGQKT